MAATMTVTASLQWLCALSLAWLVATAGASGLSTSDAEGAFYHILRRFHLRMIEGLALPLYGFPTLAFFLGFVVLAPRTWARLALTLTGLAALAWSAWWLHDNILWWLPIATYVGIVCLILWTPGASQWYRQRTATNRGPLAARETGESADGLVEHRVGLAERPPDVRPAGRGPGVEDLVRDGHHAAAGGRSRQNVTPSS